MRDPALAEKILLITNDPAPHDYIHVRVHEFNADGTFVVKPCDFHGSIDPDGEPITVDPAKNIENRAEGAEPQVGEWALIDNDPAAA